MANLNIVHLIGRLTRDPEMHYIPSGSGVTTFGLAVNHYFRSSDGEKREETCFVDVQRTAVHFGPEPCRPQFFIDFFGIGYQFIIDGKGYDLHR